jgi:hypothetical protein
MALNHITLDATKAAGNRVRGVRAQGADFFAELRLLQGELAQFINGDGSSDAHYAPMQLAGVGSTNAEAHSAFVQIDTLFQALNTNSSQSALLDKFNQFVNFLGCN